MSTKKEEERNEKVIRGLMKLPPNRRCINCNSLGPQYVCTNFWTFVCIACSGIHREFTHRVKSVSMSKFTTQEVEALQRGGNQRARELFLSEWDTQRMRFPDNSNPDKIREFIKNVYVDKKYAGSRSSDKPPRDAQKGEEDHRRASSYHSFSQSPPYDHQYEERRYGRQAGMLTRKPGSDRGHYEGKMSSFLYSPGHQAEQIYEDRFANESYGSRMSDYSVSSDTFRSGGQSPTFHEPGYGSPPAQIRDILVEDTQPQKLGISPESNVKEDINRIPRAHRSTSSGSFGSFDSNSMSTKSANSGSLIDSVLEPEHASAIRPTDTSTFPSLPQVPSAANTSKIDLFNQEFVQSQSTSLAPSLDLFGDVNHQPLANSSKEQKPVADEGWATFDLPRHVEPQFKENKGLPPVVPPGGRDAPKKDIDLFASMHNSTGWFPVQNSTGPEHSSVVADQWSVGLNEARLSVDSGNSQLWNAFHDSKGNTPQPLPGIIPQNTESQGLLHRPPTSVPAPGDPYFGLGAQEVKFNDGFLRPAVDDKAFGVASATGMVCPSFPPSAALPMVGAALERKASNPFDLPYDLDSEANNVFLDMSSLQAALPDTFLGGSMPDPWFTQNPLPSFGAPVTQGGLAYIGGQVPSAQLQNIPSQGPVASLGGNPFA